MISYCFDLIYASPVKPRPGHGNRADTPEYTDEDEQSVLGCTATATHQRAAPPSPELSVIAGPLLGYGRQRRQDDPQGIDCPGWLVYAGGGQASEKITTTGGPSAI